MDRPITFDWALSLLPDELKPVLKMLKVNSESQNKQMVLGNRHPKMDLLAANLLELVWVSQSHKFVCFGDFWPEADEDHTAWYHSFLGMAGELELSYLSWPIAHKGMNGVFLCFFKRDNIQSMRVLDLYTWVRNEINYKRLPDYMKHMYLGLIAGYTLEEIDEHIKHLKKEYGD